jgi:hypothetical protein
VIEIENRWILLKVFASLVTHRLSSGHQRFVCSLDQDGNNHVSLENVVFLDQSDSNHGSLCQSGNKHGPLCQSGDEISLDQGEDEVSLDQDDNNHVLLNQSDKNDNNHLISFEIEIFDVP